MKFKAKAIVLIVSPNLGKGHFLQYLNRYIAILAKVIHEVNIYVLVSNKAEKEIAEQTVMKFGNLVKVLDINEQLIHLKYYYFIKKYFERHVLNGQVGQLSKIQIPINIEFYHTLLLFKIRLKHIYNPLYLFNMYGDTLTTLPKLSTLHNYIKKIISFKYVILVFDLLKFMQIKDSENKNFHAILSTKNVDDKISPKNLYFIPDISDVTLPGIRKSSNAQLIDKRSQSKPKMLFIGNIKVDRGILEFLKVAESDKEQEIFYVICGLCEDDDLKDKIKSFAKEKNNIFIFLQFIENEIEYNEIVNTCDILWLNFREKNTNSSNNLYKAIYFDKPIILNPSGSLIELVRRFDIKCGTFTNPNAKEILKFKAYYELSSSRLESNRKYLEFNSMEKLEQILAEVFD